jgi:hypothetical protein
MAKRSRGAARPGQRRPANRPPQRFQAARPAAPATSRATGLTADEEARAAEIEAQMIAEERASDDARARSRDRGRVGADIVRGRTRDGSLLATRAAEEYTYVVRDVRRIVQVGGGLMVVMLLVWLVLEVVKPF